MVMPSRAKKLEGVETRHGTPKTNGHGEGIVQTTNRNGDENRSSKKIPWAVMPVQVRVLFRVLNEIIHLS